MSIFSDKLICLVTGASQNVGAALAHGLALKLLPGSTLILSSRSKDRLVGVKDEILAKVKNDSIKVILVEWDTKRPNAEQYRTDLKNAIGSDVQSYPCALIVHNAFQLGNMSKRVADLTDPAELQELLTVNVVAPLVLNAIFLDVVKPVGRKFVVNVSAPSATKALPSFGMTALGKCPAYAALNVLAKECPDVRVLHFDPGMVDTEGLRTIRDKSFYDEIRHWIQSFYDEGKLLELGQTAEALVRLLEENKFQSGEYISAYTVVGGK